MKYLSVKISSKKTTRKIYPGKITDIINEVSVCQFFIFFSLIFGK